MVQIHSPRPHRTRTYHKRRNRRAPGATARELVASYLYQVHLHHWLECNDHGRFLIDDGICFPLLPARYGPRFRVR